MKKTYTYYLLISLISLITISCHEDTMENTASSPVEMSDSNTWDGFVYPHSANYISTTRAGSFENDWENWDNYTLPDGSILPLPWKDETYGGLDVLVAKDVKKADGWLMISHSLNEDPKTRGLVYRILFYNQKAGDLKIFQFMEDAPINHSTGFWHVNFVTQQSMSNSLNEVALPTSVKFSAKEYQWMTAVGSANNRNVFGKGWSIVNIPNLAYDPNAQLDQTLQISTSADTRTLYDLLGTSKSQTEGLIITNGSSNPFGDFQNSLSNWYGDKAETWVNDKIKDNIIKPKFLNTVVTGIVTQGAKGLITAGANLVLSKLFGSFSRPTPTISSVRLATKTESTITGTGVTPGITGLTDYTVSVGKNKTGIELGVWNLTENPTIYMHPVGVVSRLNNGFDSDENAYRFINSGKYKYNIVVNPQLTPNLKKYWVECDAVMYTGNQDKLPKPMKDFSDFGSIGYSPNKSNGAFAATEAKDLLMKSDVSIWDKVKVDCTFNRLWSTYGKDKYNPIYKYVYAPDNINLIRGGFSLPKDKYYAKVTVYMVTEFENCLDTVVDMRTFVPKFEWDPDLVKQYKGASMSGLQGLASGDRILKTIDNHVIENNRSSYNTLKEDAYETDQEQTMETDE